MDSGCQDRSIFEWINFWCDHTTKMDDFPCSSVIPFQPIIIYIYFHAVKVIISDFLDHLLISNSSNTGETHFNDAGTSYTIGSMSTKKIPIYSWFMYDAADEHFDSLFFLMIRRRPFIDHGAWLQMIGSIRISIRNCSIHNIFDASIKPSRLPDYVFGRL